ncbi:MAG: ABC transporter ATP-binding protein [Bryobacteraceae bacterium]
MSTSVGGSGLWDCRGPLYTLPLDPKCMALLEVRNATKLYPGEGAPVVALQDLSFELDAGDIVAFVGRSGCGKSTLLNLCGAMDFPTSGEIVLDGQLTTRLADPDLTRLRREKVGFVFQSFQLLHTLTVLENVELPILLAQKRNARQTAFERLGWLQMEPYANRLPHQLSGGQQQRVAIARALVHSPRLVLADEPTGNLDTATGELVLELLVRAAREFGVAVMIATHSSEAMSAADRVVQLRDGRMQEAVALR